MPKPLRDWSLATRINLTVAAILLAFFAVTAVLDYRQQKDFVLAEALAQARLIATEAIRTREYLSDQLLAGDVTLSQQRFGLIPVIVSTRIGEQVAQDLGYRIRQISERHRNPANAPDAFEQAALQRFAANPEARDYSAFAEFDGQPVLRYLQPFRAERSCLECHGDPQTAPEFIRTLYPPASDRGYHYQLGEVIGAASVTIPLSRLDAQVSANLRLDLATAAAIFCALCLCLWLLVRTVVLRPLERVSAAIAAVVRSGRIETRLPERGADEIGRLISGFNAMQEALEESIGQLEESEGRFRMLTETAHDAILAFLANGQLILCNRQAARLFGYSQQEALGMAVDALLHDSCREVRTVGVAAYLRDHEAQLLQQLTPVAARRRDGALLHLELALSVADSGGHRFYTAVLREPVVVTKETEPG